MNLFASKQESTPEEEKNNKHRVKKPVAQWQYRPDDESDSGNDNLSDKPKHIEPVTWTASEFIAHQKSAKWYTLLGMATLATATLIYLITRDKITAGVIIFAALIFGYYAARKPRVLEYRLDEDGLVIGSKSYAYKVFKSFSLFEEGAFMGIVLMPLKRFMPSISLYFEPKDEEKITTILTERLPVEEHKPDVVDKFIKQIRF